MANVTNLVAYRSTPDIEVTFDDPKIIKIAKLTLILADSSVDMATKRSCLRLAVKMGYITSTEADVLAHHRKELESFMKEEKSADV